MRFNVWRCSLCRLLLLSFLTTVVLLSLLPIASLFTVPGMLLLPLLYATALFSVCFFLHGLPLLSLPYATAILKDCYRSLFCLLLLSLLLVLLLCTRFVMTKIHPLAFGGRLDGAVDGSISARLRALQFLTADDLNVAVHARDDTVLGLAQV